MKNGMNLEFKGKFVNNKFQLICFENLFIEAINKITDFIFSNLFYRKALKNSELSCYKN